MSEVSDATQIIMMTARGGYLLGKISIALDDPDTLEKMKTTDDVDWILKVLS